MVKTSPALKERVLTSTSDDPTGMIPDRYRSEPANSNVLLVVILAEFWFPEWMTPKPLDSVLSDRMYWVVN